MTGKKHDFDYLIEWSSMPDDGLKILYSEDVKQILYRILSELDRDQEFSSSVSAENFPYIVRRLRELKRNGSRALGDAIIEAAAFMDKGQFDKAQAVYERFLSSSPPRFYERIAMDLLNALSDDGT